MKKLKWNHARIFLYSILLLFIATLLSCNDDDEPECDCVKVTYEYDWTICFDDVTGLPYRCEINRSISKEENYNGLAMCSADLYK
jgi:hypothetical protein